MRVVPACLLLATITHGFLTRPPPLIRPSGWSNSCSTSTQKQQQRQHVQGAQHQCSPSSHRQHRSKVPTLSSSSSSSLPVSEDDIDGDGLIVGLNKYSHDSAVCVLRASDGACLFAGEKERITRIKHDGGDTGELVQHALESIGAKMGDVRLVVSNNHHHRVAPFERRQVLPLSYCAVLFVRMFRRFRFSYRETAASNSKRLEATNGTHVQPCYDCVSATSRFYYSVANATP